MITLEALTVLDAIEKRGSYAGAAEYLNKVPSALSYIVQKLEDELKVTLFVRQGRRSVLTQAGRHLVEEGRKVINAVEQISEQTQTIANGWESKLTIAFDTIVCFDKLTNMLNEFLQFHPSIELNLVEEVMHGTWEALMQDEVDLIIGAPEPIPLHKGMSTRSMGYVKNILVASPNHPLASSTRPVEAEDLASFRTVIVRDSAKTEVAWSKNIIEQSMHFYVQSMQQKIIAIKNNLGVGFLPQDRIQCELGSGALVPLDSHISQSNPELYLAWKTVNRGKGLASLRDIIGKQLAQEG